MKVSELTGPILDWAVAIAEGLTPYLVHGQVAYTDPGHGARVYFRPSTDWSQGGPIIEREKLELRPGLFHSKFWTCWGQTRQGHRNSQQGKTGPTPLVAAMRCFVALRLGEEIELLVEVSL